MILSATTSPIIMSTTNTTPAPMSNLKRQSTLKNTKTSMQLSNTSLPQSHQGKTNQNPVIRYNDLPSTSNSTINNAKVVVILLSVITLMVMKK
jgi:hypothetical protein